MSESVLFLTQNHNADRTTVGLRQRKGCEGTEVVFESSSHLESRINRKSVIYIVTESVYKIKTVEEKKQKSKAPPPKKKIKNKKQQI